MARISDLPENVIETILMCLPTRDAVRSSILSRKWSHRWAKLPQLILDGTLWDKSTTIHSARTTVSMILSQLLLFHEGPIKKFILSIPGLESCPEIDYLIFVLIRNGIEDLTLEMSTSECYRFPLAFFTCQQLRHLSLKSCLIESTPAFKGFSRLITLRLRRVTVSAKVLGSLISSCPLLEKLVLLSTPYCNNDEIEIDAPNLKTLCVMNTAKCNVVELFHGLPVLEKLVLGNLSDKYFAAGEVPTRLPIALVCLKNLYICETMLDELDELSFILCLIRSSPNLKHIEIRFSTENVSSTNADLEFLKEQDYSDVMLNELKEVELKNVTGTRPQLEVIEILLAKSPSLGKMQIQNHLGQSAEGFKLLKELTKFQRASKKAEVIYADV